MPKTETTLSPVKLSACYPLAAGGFMWVIELWNGDGMSGEAKTSDDCEYIIRSITEERMDCNV